MRTMSYIGEWVLIPELSLYASGVPPVVGRYTIARSTDGQLTLNVSWRMDGDEADRYMSFGGPADGARIALPPSDVGPDAFTLTHIDEQTLDSAAYLGTQRVAYARRVASTDSLLLAVVQEALTPEGLPVRNFQLYRRAAG